MVDERNKTVARVRVLTDLDLNVEVAEGVRGVAQQDRGCGGAGRVGECESALVGGLGTAEEREEEQEGNTAHDKKKTNEKAYRDDGVNKCQSYVFVDLCGGTWLCALIKIATSGRATQDEELQWASGRSGRRRGDDSFTEQTTSILLERTGFMSRD